MHSVCVSSQLLVSMLFIAVPTNKIFLTLVIYTEIQNMLMCVTRGFKC